MFAVVVVTYSAEPATLDACLMSIRAAGSTDHLIVVDTGGGANPSDRAVECIATDNRGYGAAANLGFAAARRRGADLIALVNDDVMVTPGWLDRLAAELGGSVGAAQPQLVYASTDPLIVNSLGVALDRYGAGSDIGDGEPSEPVGAPSDLEIFTGGAVLFRDDFLLETGGFDERYFLYYEDIDLALRGRSLGWGYRLVPACVVEHARGATTSRDPERTLFLQERNRLWAAFRFASPLTMLRATWLSLRRLRHQPRDVHRRAVAAGLAGAPRRLVERLRAENSSSAA